MRRMFAMLRGRREIPLPPEELRSRVGSIGDDFKPIGEEFLGYFKDLAYLRPQERVLDIGCGVGRMALPLTQYLSWRGLYEGFDTEKAAVDWCSKNITPSYRNFRFQWGNIFNKKYNPSGSRKAAEFDFPYRDESFDFVFLTSVFTHMLPRDLEHYLYEISRVLRHSGRCLITYFLLNDESLQLMDAKKSSIDFTFTDGVYRTTHPHLPEEVIAYNEKFIHMLYEKYGLQIAEPTHYGYWCKRENFLSFQDIIIAAKK